MKRTDAEKAKVVELSGKGWRGSDISRFLGLPESTVSYILHHAKNKGTGTGTPQDVQKPQAKPASKKIPAKAIQSKLQIKAVQNRLQAKALLRSIHPKAVQNRHLTKAAVKKPQAKPAAVPEVAQKRHTIKRSEEERAEVVRLSHQGWSISQIANFMDFPTSTVFYIIKRARDTAGISAVQNKVMAWKDEPSNRAKNQMAADNSNQSGRESPQMMSHTAEMIGTLRMKIQAVADEDEPENEKGVQSITHKAKQTSGQRMKGHIPAMGDKIRPTSRQGMQNVSREAKVLGGLRIMEMMDDDSRPNSRQETRKVKEAIGQKKKQYVSHSMATKMEVLRRFELGERECDIARDLGIGASTIRAMRNSACLRKQYKETAWSDGERKERTVVDLECMDVDGDVKEEVEVCIEEDVEELVEDGLSPEPPKDVVMESMERLLKIWIDGQVSRGCVVRDGAIQSKALSLWRFVYDGLTREEAAGVERDFKASSLWLRQFKERAGLYTLPSYSSHSPNPSLKTYTQQSSPECVSGDDTEAAARQRPGEGGGVGGHPNQRSERVAKEFSTLLRAKIELGGYTARQVINMAETCLCWKKLPTNTVIALDSCASQALRASSDSFSLLLGANATGDLKLKPLLVYHQEKPCSLAGYIKEHLPVIWRTHPKGKLTAALCQNYVVEYLSQQCREYAAQHSLENRFLLVVEATPAHPPSMDDWAENIEVIFVSPKNKNGSNTRNTGNDSTTAVAATQPMGKGISSTFNLCYLRRVFEQLVRETDGSSDNYLSSVCAFWKGYNIRKALSNIKMAWDDVAPFTVNAAWQNMWPECVEDSLAQKMERETSEVSEDALVSLAHRAGFLLVNAQNVRDWKDGHNQDPQNNRQSDMNPNLTENHTLDKQCEEAEEEEEVELVKTLGIGSLRQALKLLEDAMAIFENSDPNLTRSCEARALVESGVKGYRELLAAKKMKAQNSSIFSALNHKQQQQQQHDEQEEQEEEQEEQQEEQEQQQEEQEGDEQQQEQQEEEPEQQEDVQE